MPENRRQDFRIDDILAIQDEMISREEFEHRKQYPSIRSRQNAMIQDMIGKDITSEQLMGAVNHDLAHALEALDTKLNYLIGINILNDANRSDLTERPINLSVTGASFHSDQQYKRGDYVSLTMVLPSFPPAILELLAEVTWVKNSKHKSSHIGLRFIYRCHDEESSIAKYVFLRHRENIRLQAKSNEKALPS